MANYSSNRRSTHLRRDWFSSATPRRKKRGGEEEFGIPENVTEIKDARAIRRARKKGRKKESVKMRDIEDFKRARKRRTEESATLKLLRTLP